MSNLSDLERHLADIYKDCYFKMYMQSNKFFAEFEKEDERMCEDVANGVISNSEYKRWRMVKMAEKQRLNGLTTQLCEMVNQTNHIAMSFINDNLSSFYANGYNALSKEADINFDYRFDIINEDAVRNLALDDIELLPTREVDDIKDYAYNRQKIRNRVLQGIIKGDSIDKMADDVARVTNLNMQTAIRNVRTMVTSAENKGRMDSYKRAKEDGVIIQKEWLATANSPRTRHWHLELNGAVAEIDEPFHNAYGDIMFPADPNAHPANVYNCRCTLVAKVNGFKKAQVEKAEEEKQVEEPPATTEDAIRTAHDLGVKYAQFEKMPLEQVNNAIDAVRTLPKDCVPKVIASGKDVSTVTGRPLGRKADQWWGVTYDYRAFSLRTMQLGYDATDFDGGLIVGLNTQKFKTMDALTKAKKATNEAYFAKTGRYWSFNTDGKATAYHEIGHCFADVRGLPKGWADASARWAEESTCDLLKKPDEAFAEAWAAYHLGDKRLPDYISAIIGGLK